MEKKQFIDKYNLNATTISDLNAVIAHEIEKAKGEDKPSPNPIREAYDAFKPIRVKNWKKDLWIKKHSEAQSISENCTIYNNCNIIFDFDENPQYWELYTEPEADKPAPTDEDWNKSQVTDQPAPAKPKFNQDRFEAMFRAVVASGRTESYDQDFLATNICLEKLDAYYATI